MGYLLGKAAIFNGYNALQTQKYGPESRGAPVKSDLVVSKDQIRYPLFQDINILIDCIIQAYLIGFIIEKGQLQADILVPFRLYQQGYESGLYEKFGGFEINSFSKCIFQVIEIN